MKITVWGINYSPELVGIGVYNTDLCEYLAAQGHDVTMVTGFPYYPQWKVAEQDRGSLYRLDVLNGVQVWRCRQYVPNNPSVIRRMVHEASFALTSFFKLLTLPSADIYIGVTPPLILGLGLWLISAIKRAPSILHVQDILPNAAVGLGMLKPGLFTKTLVWLQALSYKKATRVSSISKRMCEVIRKMGAQANEILLLPNWVDMPSNASLPKAQQWKRAHNIGDSTLVVSYAGNLGAKQGLDVVIDAARILRDRDGALFVIAGNGGQEHVYKQLCSDNQVTNVMFQDVLPKDEHTALILDSAICVVPQKAGATADFLPSKLLKILALGKPVVTNADEDSPLHDAVQEGNFGITVQPGDPKALAKGIEDLLNDNARRETLGQSGREYVQQFERIAVLSKFESVLIETLRK